MRISVQSIATGIGLITGVGAILGWILNPELIQPDDSGCVKFSRIGWNTALVLDDKDIDGICGPKTKAYIHDFSQSGSTWRCNGPCAEGNAQAFTIKPGCRYPIMIDNREIRLKYCGTDQSGTSAVFSVLLCPSFSQYASCNG